MRTLSFVAFAVMASVGVVAQSPQLFSYQAVVRDAGNILVTQSPVGIRVSILQGSPSGPAVYVEIHTPTTNANGLASVAVGGGSVVSGSIVAIDWSAGPYFIKTETDPAGGTAYSIVGTTQLLSVPYALYSERTGDTTMWRRDGSHLYYNSGRVGIGTNNPELLLHVVRDDVGDGSMVRLQSNVLGYGSNIQMMGSNYNRLWSLSTEADYSAISIRLSDTTSTSMQDFVRVTDLGNVGIGTIAPQRRLHINDVMRLEPRSTAPSSPSKGDMYFDSTINKLRVYDGTTWQNCW